MELMTFETSNARRVTVHPNHIVSITTDGETTGGHPCCEVSFSNGSYIRAVGPRDKLTAAWVHALNANLDPITI